MAQPNIESRLLYALDRVSDGVLSVDSDWVITFANVAVGRLLGRSRDSLVGRVLWTALPEAITRVFKPHLQRALDQQEFTEFEAFYPPIDKWLSIRVFPSLDGITIYAYDESDRHQRQEALRQADARLRKVQQIAHLGHWEYDLATCRFDWLADEMFSIHGITRAAWDRTLVSFVFLVFPEDRPAVLDAIDQTLLSGSAQIDHRIVCPDGELRYIRKCMEAVYGKDGQPLRILGTCQDISEQKRSELALEDSNRALRILSGSNKALVQASDEAVLLRQICQVAVEVGGHVFAWVAVPSPANDGTLVPVGWYGGASAVDAQACAEHGSGDEPVRRAIGERAVQVATDIEDLSDRYRSVAALPMIAGDDCLGALVIASAQPDAFSDASLEVLRELADDLAFGLTALRLRLERRQFHARLDDSLLKAVEALGTMAEVRDPYTAGHQHRVAQLCQAIARMLGLAEDQTRGIWVAGTIHDIGKTAIPAEILSKPGRLAPLEFEFIKSHSQVGHDIVRGIDFPWPVAEMVLQHHERLDGSGYPLGLRGDEIGVGSRILSVADVVEAMTHFRPYRPGLGLSAALDEITRNRGVLYDATVVDACLSVFQARLLDWSASTVMGQTRPWTKGTKDLA